MSKLDPKSLATVDAVRSAVEKGQITALEAMDRQKEILDAEKAKQNGPYVLPIEICRALFAKPEIEAKSSGNVGRRMKVITEVDKNGHTWLGSLEVWQVGNDAEKAERLALRLERREENRLKRAGENAPAAPAPAPATKPVRKNDEIPF